MAVTVIWRGACAPHVATVYKYRIATAEDVANYHREGSKVEYKAQSAPIVEMAVGIMDDHLAVVYGLDAEGKEVCAKSLRAGQRRALDRVPLDRLEPQIAALLDIQPL